MDMESSSRFSCGHVARDDREVVAAKLAPDFLNTLRPENLPPNLAGRQRLSASRASKLL